MSYCKIGKRVIYRSKEKKLYGVIEDEVSLLETPAENFRNSIQLIRWKDGSQSIRFCYYIRKNERRTHWIFANRPLSIQPKYLKELLIEASKKKWFKYA